MISRLNDPTKFDSEHLLPVSLETGSRACSGHTLKAAAWMPGNRTRCHTQRWEAPRMGGLFGNRQDIFGFSHYRDAKNQRPPYKCAPKQAPKKTAAKHVLEARRTDPIVNGLRAGLRGPRAALVQVRIIRCQDKRAPGIRTGICTKGHLQSHP